MFTVTILVLCPGINVASVVASARQEQLFLNWEQAEKGMRSLVVEFTLERKDRVFDASVYLEGSFKLLRTEEGKILALYEEKRVKPEAVDQRPVVGLLNEDVLYLLKSDEKTAIKLVFGKGNVQGFLGKYWNPFVVLLDKKRAQASWRLAVVKQDEWYTYLMVEPKGARRSGWLRRSNTFEEGRVVLMNKPSGSIPKDMPRQLWYRNETNECTVEVRKWSYNAADAPKVEEFIWPERRPGWKVIEGPPLLHWLK